MTLATPSLEEELREKLLERLALVEALERGDKEALRRFHQEAKLLLLRGREEEVRKLWRKYQGFFAHGHEIRPEAVRPRLLLVEEKWQGELFRLARLLWSMPFSAGYGRRLRFLVIDEGHGKLLGLLALGSPPLGLAARDNLFTYDDKARRVNETADLWTLGAVPPYNFLLGGKLVALLAASNEVREAYRKRYQGRRTFLEGREISGELLALTTTSAFGRSSLYSRLKYRGEWIARPIGYTKGYGTFHLDPLWEEARAFLRSRGIAEGGYEVGAKRRIILWEKVLHLLGLPPVARHGVRREVFLFPLVENLEEAMRGAPPRYRDLPGEELIQYWRERWLLPRAERDSRYLAWRKEEAWEWIGLDSPRGALWAMEGG